MKDTNINKLIINQLTKEQYKNLGDTKAKNELYDITDEEHFTSEEIDNLLSDKQDRLTSLNAGANINIEEILISEYQYLEYIQNNKYGRETNIDTGFKWNTIKKIKATIEVISNASQHNLVFVSLPNNSLGSPYFCLDGLNYGFDSFTSSYEDEYFTAQFETSNSDNIFIGGWSDNSYTGSYKYKNVKLYDINNNLVANFIPARRISDDEIGIYDIITQTFFQGTGTKKFIAGNAVESGTNNKILQISAKVPTKTSELENDSNFINTETDPIYTADKPNLALKTEIPTKVSSLTNDSGYQTATDVASMIASIPQFEIKIVDELPAEGQKMILYLVPKTSASGDNIYDEYIWLEGTSSFELVGSTTIDLSDYYTKTATDELLEDKQPKISIVTKSNTYEEVKDLLEQGRTVGIYIYGRLLVCDSASTESTFTFQSTAYGKYGYWAICTLLANGNTFWNNSSTILAETSQLPTKISQLTNDSNFITSDYHDDTKQDKLTAGEGIKIENNVISTESTKILTDDVTIIQNDDNTITTIGTKTKSNTNLYDWVGTSEQYNTDISNGTITSDTQCLITDDEIELVEYIPIATNDTLGLVKPDGTSITINEQGVISATGGSGSVDIVQTTGNSTTSVMSQKATTDMPAFKEVVTPTKMLQAQNTQYCTSYDTFDYEDIKVAQVYCRQAYNSTSINHYRTGDIRYTSAISLYKDSKNYLSIIFEGYKLVVSNAKGGVVINKVDLGLIHSGATNINLPTNTAWCAEINLQEKTCTFYIMKNGELSVYGKVVDISTWDLSHLDTFNIVFGCSEYLSDSFCYHCLLNEKTKIDKIINTPIEYGKYNCYDTYLKNDIKPLTVTGIYADNTASGASAGTLIEKYDNLHKVFSFSVPEGSTMPNYLGLYGEIQGAQHLGQICVIKCKFLEFAEGAVIRYANQALYIYEGTKFVHLSTWGAPLFVPELNVEYTFVIRQEKIKPDGRYLLRGVGDFTIEFLDMYYMVPQSANICAETWDGNFFRGTLPFIGTDILFSNDYSKITTSRTGLGVPQYYQTTDSNGNTYMYNGTTWKQIDNVITDNTLTTTDKTIVGAINELNSSIGDISTALDSIIAGE